MIDRTGQGPRAGRQRGGRREQGGAVRAVQSDHKWNYRRINYEPSQKTEACTVGVAMDLGGRKGVGGRRVCVGLGQ